MDDKKYRIDYEPVTASDLIDRASYHNQAFARDWLKSTSRAASILRELGHKVDDNPAFQR